MALKTPFYAGPHSAKIDELRSNIAEAMNISADNVLLIDVYRIEDVNSLGIAFEFVDTTKPGAPADVEAAARFQLMMQDPNGALYVPRTGSRMSEHLDPDYSLLPKSTSADWMKWGLVIGACVLGLCLLLFEVKRRRAAWARKRRIEAVEMNSCPPASLAGSSRSAAAALPQRWPASAHAHPQPQPHPIPPSSSSNFNPFSRRQPHSFSPHHHASAPVPPFDEAPPAYTPDPLADYQPSAPPDYYSSVAN